MAVIDRNGVVLSASNPPSTSTPTADLAIKTACVVATTGANIVLSGVQTIDGISVGNANERVLVKDQADATSNGIYNASTGNWTRTIDANNSTQWAQGLQVEVSEGTLNDNSIWLLTTPNPVTLGTSEISFVRQLSPDSGAVLMQPFPGQISGQPWSVVDPFGHPISTLGTTTCGLQEALTFALTNGYAFRCIGTGLGTTSGGGAVLECTTPVVLPPIQLGYIEFEDVTINFSSAIGSNSGLVFDSAEILTFILNGQIVSQGTGAAVEIKPRNPVVGDGFVGFTQNWIDIKAIACNGNSPTAKALMLTPFGGSISETTFKLGEFAGGGSGVNAGYGILFNNPTNNLYVIEQCIWDVGSIHGFGVSNATGAIQIGTGTSNQGNLYGHQWRIGSIRPVNNSSGFVTYGAFDRVSLSVTNQEGNATNAVLFESGAADNRFELVYSTGLSGATFQDSSGNTTNRFDGVSNIAGLANGQQSFTPQFVATNGGAGTTAGFLAKAASQPSFAWQNTGAAANSGIWDAVAQTSPGPSLQIRAVNDAQSIATVAIEIDRSTTTITAVKFPSSGIAIGTAGSIVGSVAFSNATSGSITVQPATGALGSAVLTLPAATDTVAVLAASQTFSNKSFIAGGGVGTIKPAGVIYIATSPVGTGADTTEDVLQTFSLPASTFDVAGRAVRIKAAGTYGADANNKTIKVYFGAQIYNTGTISQNNTAWAIELIVWCTGTNTQSYFTSGLYAGTAIVGAGSGNLTQTASGAITIKVTGQNGSAVANDIICTTMIVEMLN